MWINTDFDVIVQDVDQPAFAYPLSPSPLTQEFLHTVDVKLSISTLYQGSSSISQATPSSVRNFIAATFDNVIQFSIREMKIRQFVKLTQGWVMNFYID